MDKDLRIEMLERRVEVLEGRVDMLERALIAEFATPVEWQLSVSEQRVFGVLVQRDIATKDAIMAALYRDNGNDEPDIKIVDVFVCKLRKKVARFGINIQTRWGMGYSLADRQSYARAA